MTRARSTGIALLALVLALIAALMVSSADAGSDAGASGGTGGAGWTEDHPRAGKRKFAVTALSSRPDAVSGGDALLRVTLPGGTPPGSVRIALNGQDVTGAFSAGADGLTGLVTGLRKRANTVVARASSGVTARLRLTNHPAAGPVFSGPHQRPYVCETEHFTLPVLGGTLGEPLDADCSVRTRVDYFYRTTGGAFRPLPGGADAALYPADLAMTTTSTGRKVPFVVRMETGTRNRAVYQTTVLHDPVGEPDPTPLT
ncbi:DUF6351 family protein, partial [Streptomyces boncukensis]